MINKAAADEALSRARGLAASGVALTERVRRERALLRKAIDAELVVLAGHAHALAPAATGGDADAAAKVIRIHELRGELHNALAALGDDA